MTAQIIDLPDPDLYAAKVAAKVRGVAAEKQIRGSQLALALGVSQNAMSRRMTGKLPFGIGELAEVAAVLGVQVQDLLPHRDSNTEPADTPPAEVINLAQWVEDHPEKGRGTGRYDDRDPGRMADIVDFPTVSEPPYAATRWA